MLVGAPISRPSNEVIEAIEYAYKRLDQGDDAFFQDLKASVISMDVLRFMVDSDLWFRLTKAERYGTVAVYDKDGPGVWEVPGDPEIQRGFQDLKDWKMEDKARIEAAGGVYQEDRDSWLESIGAVFHKTGASFSPPLN